MADACTRCHCARKSSPATNTAGSRRRGFLAGRRHRPAPVSLGRQSWGAGRAANRPRRAAAAVRGARRQRTNRPCARFHPARVGGPDLALTPFRKPMQWTLSPRARHLYFPNLQRQNRLAHRSRRGRRITSSDGSAVRSTCPAPKMPTTTRRPRLAGCAAGSQFMNACDARQSYPTWIFLAWVSTVFGNTRVSTPFSADALMPSASMALDRVNSRLKCPTLYSVYTGLKSR